MKNQSDELAKRLPPQFFIYLFLQNLSRNYVKSMYTASTNKRLQWAFTSTFNLHLGNGSFYLTEPQGLGQKRPP